MAEAEESTPPVPPEENNNAPSTTAKPRPPKPNEKEEAERLAAIQEGAKEEQEKLNKIQDDIRAKQAENRAIDTQIRAEQTKLAPKQALRNNLRAERKKLYDEKAAATARVQEKKAQSERMRASLRYTKLDQIDDAIKKLAYRQKTVSMSLSEEKNLIKEIEGLKATRKSVLAFHMHQQQNKGDEQLVRDLRTAIRVKSQELSRAEDDLNKSGVHMRELKNNLRRKKAELPQLHQEMQQLRANLSKARQATNKVRAEYRKQRDAYNAWSYQQRKIQRARRAEEEKLWRAEQEERRRKEEEELAKQKPWLTEIATCDMLIDYLRPKLPKQNKNGGCTDENANVVKLTMTLDDGTVIEPLGKKQGGDFVMMGGRAGRNGKRFYGKKGLHKKGNKKKNKVQPLKLSTDLLFSFQSLKLSPPTSTAQVASAIEQLQQKREYFDKLPRPVKKTKAKKAASAQANDAEGVEECGDSNGGVADADVGETVVVAKDEGAEVEAPSTTTSVEADAKEGSGDCDAETESQSMDAQEATTEDVKAELKELIEATGGQGAAAAEEETKGGDETSPTIKYNQYYIYEDDRCFQGLDAPGLDSLVLLNTEKSGKTSAFDYDDADFTLVVFWAKYLKDNCYPMLLSLDKLAKVSETLQIACVATDPEQKDVESFIKNGMKNGKLKYPVVDLTLCYDANGEVKKAFEALQIGTDALLAPQIFVVNKAGKCVYRQPFSKAYRYEVVGAQAPFEAQLERIQKGEVLVDIKGPNPELQLLLQDEKEAAEFGDGEAPSLFDTVDDGAW